MAGIKYDDGKPTMDLLPWEALWEVGKVLAYGKLKYNANNWKSGMKWSRPAAALQRHYVKWSLGISTDRESGLLHMAQVTCNALFLLTYEILGLGEDDRFKLSPEAAKEWEDKFDKLNEEQVKLWNEAMVAIEKARAEKLASTVTLTNVVSLPSSKLPTPKPKKKSKSRTKK